MTRRSIAIRTGIATVALTALGLAAASPASAHTTNMYTYLYDDVATDMSSYATYGKSDGVVTPLATLFDLENQVQGIEVANEVGTEVGFTVDFDPYVLSWNHTTGQFGDFLAAYIPNEELEELTGLDTLNDGTTVTIVNYEDEITEELFVEVWAIASVNKGTGELIPLVDITDAISVQGEVTYNLTSLATDPATGITYVFLQGQASNEVYFLPVTVASATVGDPTLFQSDYLDDGEIQGADFDQGDGSLYINYANNLNLQYELLRLGAPSTWVLADPTFISTAPAQYEDTSLALLALTIEYTSLADTGAEIPVMVWLVASTAAVIFGGVTIMVARRRSEAGTV